MARDDALKALEAHIAALGLAEGDRLPPERKLAATLQLSRRSLREALTALEVANRIWRGVGQGTFLGPKPAIEREGSGQPIASSNPVLVIEARLALEPSIAALAAMKWTRPDSDLIENCVRRNAETRDHLSWGRWDSAFHHAVASATHNPLLIALFEQLDASRELASWGRMRARILTDEKRRESAAEHRRIADAIAERDTEKAHQAMWDHLQAVNRSIQSIKPGFPNSSSALGRPFSEIRAKSH